MYIKSFIILILFIFACHLKGQFYLNGNDRTGKKLKQIETPNFKVVFPEGYENDGIKLANKLEKALSLVTYSLEHKPEKKIPVLLHTGYAFSNGFAALAPRRSELYNQPPQYSYSQDWYEQLAIHEIRHIIQLDKIESGIFKLARIAFGEGAAGILAGLYPLWAYEGDAVVTETAVTKMGRGRSPSFLMGLKAISTENENTFSYQKAILGSYKDFVPDHYVYGYVLSSTARVKYDSLFWSNILHDIPGKALTLFPVYFSMKKRYGLSKQKLYSESITYYKNIWKQDQQEFVSYPKIKHTSKNDYIHYRYPLLTERNSIICIKEDMSQIARFVEIDENGQEDILKLPGYFDEAYISYAKNYLVWNEIKNHPRWDLEQSSVIKMYNLKTGRVKTIGRGSRYVAPNINRDGNKIVAVETGLDGKENIVVFSVEDGDILTTIPVEGEYVKLPYWHPEEDRIVYTKLVDGGEVLEIMDLQKMQTTRLMGPVTQEMEKPVFWGNYILFSATFDGTNNIYAIDINSKELFRITRSKFGAFDPEILPNNDVLYFSEYTSHGFDVAYVKIDKSIFEPIKKEDFYESNIIKELVSQEKNLNKEASYEKKNYDITRYRRWKHLLNIHTWLPFYPDLGYDFETGSPVYPGAVLFTQNLTGTLYGWGGYSYREGNHFGNVRMVYRGLWPVLSLDYEIGGLPSVYNPFTDQPPPDLETMTQQTLSLNTYIPLFFNIGPAYINIQPGVKFSYEDDIYLDPVDSIYERGLYTFQYRNVLYLYRKMARRDIYPKFGLYVRAEYNESPFEEKYGTVFDFFTRLYLPGIMPNHSLIVTYQYDNQDYKYITYRYSRSFLRTDHAFNASQVKMLSVDYTFPLLYPDLKLGSVAYIKRIRPQFFYEQAFIKEIFSFEQRNFIDEFKQAYGVELYFDTHIANIPFPVSIGIRTSYQPDGGTYLFQSVFNFDLLGL